MNIIQKLSPNFTAGRGGKKIIAIVDHITAGLMPGCLSWMLNPKAKASTHFLITKKGEIYQLVDLKNTAWTCGLAVKPTWKLYDGTNPNYYTVNIEHEALEGETLTELQYAASLWLHQKLVKEQKISADALHIIPHSQIDTVNRPKDADNEIPWSRLFEDLKGDDYVSDVKIIANGKIMTGVILKDGKSYAPVRKLAESFGCKVGWNDATKTVTVTKEG